MSYKQRSPIIVAEGGTNATTMATTDGVVYYDGTSLVTTAVGTATHVLTSNGAGMAPTFQAAGASSISITGDSGGALVGDAFTLTGGTTGLTFGGSGSTETLAGTLIVGNGGTGATTLTDHAVLVGSGTAAVTPVATSATVGVPLVSAGAASDPAFGTAVVAGGGTGATTLTGVLTGNGTSAITGSAVTQYAVLLGDASNGVTNVASVGTASQVLTSNGAGMAPTFQDAGGGGATTVTEYTSGSGNHTLGADTVFVQILAVGGGGGGGSGNRASFGLTNGGAGGAGGRCAWYSGPVTYFGGAGANVAYSVGVGGSGGEDGVSASTVGGDTTFGIVIANGGNRGGDAGSSGGTALGPSAETMSICLTVKATGISESVLNGKGGNGGDDGSADSALPGSDQYGLFSPTGGGGGAAISSGPNSHPGKVGGSYIGAVTVVGGTAGAAGGGGDAGAGGNGNDFDSTHFIGGTGGGGGGSATGDGSGGNGGNGGYPGGGGGGGGGAQSSGSGNVSGIGGDGGAGYILVVEYA